MKRIILSLYITAWLYPCMASTSIEKEEVDIQVGKDQNGEVHPKRTPVLVPSVYIDGRVLSFDSSCIGCPVAILQDGLTVYIATVGNDLTVELPDYLSGVYEIQLQRGSITFVGEIEL